MYMELISLEFDLDSDELEFLSTSMEGALGLLL
jgi:hypothetical protein